MAAMKLKTLEQHLQQVEVFQHPKVELEQYATTPHLAACMLYTIENTFGDLSGKAVADLGCGCGTLALGATLLESAYVVGFDIDPDALDIFNANRSELEVTGCDAILCDVTRAIGPRLHDRFDTVIMNPPFGTRYKGVDLSFVEAGLRLATGAVYSLHKRATRRHVLAKAEEWGVKGKVVAELKFDLPQTYKFHKKNSVDIEVDLVRFWFDGPKSDCLLMKV